MMMMSEEEEVFPGKFVVGLEGGSTFLTMRSETMRCERT